MQTSFTLNGKAVTVDVEPNLLLSELLRERLALTGTHVGCDTSQCGACVVHIDELAVKSCSVLAVSLEGSAVTTIEGMARDGVLHPMQQAFHDCHGLQCGFCTAGMVMSSVEFIRHCPAPTEEEVRRALEGNLCRCTGYQNIVASVIKGAAAVQATSAAMEA